MEEEGIDDHFLKGPSDTLDLSSIEESKDEGDPMPGDNVLQFVKICDEVYMKPSRKKSWPESFVDSMRSLLGSIPMHEPAKRN